MSQENNTTPSARNREAYAALTEMGGNVRRRPSNWKRPCWVR